MKVFSFKCSHCLRAGTAIYVKKILEMITTTISVIRNTVKMKIREKGVSIFMIW